MIEQQQQAAFTLKSNEMNFPNVTKVWYLIGSGYSSGLGLGLVTHLTHSPRAEPHTLRGRQKYPGIGYLTESR